MKKRLIALLLVVVLLIPAGISSAATTYYRVTKSLKVRMQPSESSQVLDTYPQDAVATIKRTKNGWSYVKFVYGGGEGYVMSKYLKKASSYNAWVYSDNTSLRAKPNGSAVANATLARGTKVKVLSHGTNYDYVQSAYGNGFIRNTLLSKSKIKPSGGVSKSNIATGGDYDAWVMTSGSATTYLYSLPDTGSAKIASYSAATKVHVNSHGSTWDNVTVDGNTGWMKTAYLDTNEPAPTAVPDNGGNQNNNTGYTAYVVSANKKSVHVRKGAGKGYSVKFNVPYGAPVHVIEHGKKWDHIKYNNQTGYIDNSFLQLAKPKDADDIPTQDPNITPTPKPDFQPYWAMVNINDLNFHKQKGDWSSNVDGVGRLQYGEAVYVLEISNGWARVRYDEKYTGWVHKNYITP